MLATIPHDGLLTTFDTELLNRAERLDLSIHEVPVDWVDDPDSRVDIVATSLADFKGVWRMRRRLGPLRSRLGPLRSRLVQTTEAQDRPMRGVERAAPHAGHYQITSATVFDQLSDPPTTATPIPPRGA